MALAAKLVKVCLVTIVNLKWVEVFVVKLACIDDLAEQDILLKQMGVYLSKNRLVLDAFKIVVGERDVGVFKIGRGFIVYRV